MVVDSSAVIAIPRRRRGWIITFNVDDAGAERFGVSVGQPGPAWRYLREERS